MSKPALEFRLPPVIRKDDGSLRRVGFELEFSGLTLEEASTAVQSAVGGEVKWRSPAEIKIRVESLGDFMIELDWQYLKRTSSETEQEMQEDEWINQLSKIAAILVPVEVVCPPVPVTSLDLLHPMVEELRRAGAIGTEESLLSAYGLHINIETPSLSAATLLSYLTAYSLLQWWLVDIHKVDMSRRLSPYIDLYPEAYLKKVLAKINPTMDEIFSDYLEHNASRNRALDMLPLLAEINEDCVRGTVDDQKIKPRPAFHYRLPDCHIEQPNWSLLDPWRAWCVVEELAHRRDSLVELSAEFLDVDRFLIGVNRSRWVEFLDQWLRERDLA